MLVEWSNFQSRSRPTETRTVAPLGFLGFHRQWWCHRQMFYHFKRCHTLLNGLALLVMAAGLIAGSLLENSSVVACLAAMGTVVKGWNDFKKISLKVDISRFAYTSYAKTLIELRTYVRCRLWTILLPISPHPCPMLAPESTVVVSSTCPSRATALPMDVLESQVEYLHLLLMGKKRL